MGGGSWTREKFTSYSMSKGMSLDSLGSIKGGYSTQEMFKQRMIAPELNPYNVIRECCDSKDHPNTKPVILALDVTGSMGSAAVEVAKKLNVVMTNIYGKVKDVEFLVMGIGDLVYDDAPVQASQFESDIRIAEQLDKIYFEGGGGGNNYESYTAAWYFGARHTKLDCWNRGQKGLIITMGDEPLNPYLPRQVRSNGGLERVFGDNLQDDIETKELYGEVIQKYDVYHLNVKHGRGNYYDEKIQESFGMYLDDNHLKTVNLDNIADTIVDIVTQAFSEDSYKEGVEGGYTDTGFSQLPRNEDGLISW